MYLVIRDADGACHHLDSHDDIATQMAPLGLRIGRIAIGHAPRSGRPAVADARALAALHREFGICHADRVSVAPGDGRWPALRARFRQRHTHPDHELRVFVHGQGLFDVPLPGGGRAQLLCEAGEWVALPPGTPHAFDAGRRPDFDALRLFASSEGWVATPTADADAAPLPDLDRVLSERRLLQDALA